VGRTVLVKVVPRHRAGRIDALGPGSRRAQTRAGGGGWDIELGDGAVAGTQEAVTHAGGVQVPTRNHSPRRAQVPGKGALSGALARARNVEHGERAVGSQQVAVGHTVGVNDISRDRPRVVHAHGVGAKTGRGGRKRDSRTGRARPRAVEHNHPAV